MHRLVAGAGEIKNGQSSMCQNNSFGFVRPEPVVVGTAVADLVCHDAGDMALLSSRTILSSDETYDSAHF
jgi:hypothetical protein